MCSHNTKAEKGSAGGQPEEDEKEKYGDGEGCRRDQRRRKSHHHQLHLNHLQGPPHLKVLSSVSAAVEEGEDGAMVLKTVARLLSLTKLRGDYTSFRETRGPQDEAVNRRHTNHPSKLLLKESRHTEMPTESILILLSHFPIRNCTRRCYRRQTNKER